MFPGIAVFCVEIYLNTAVAYLSSTIPPLETLLLYIKGIRQSSMLDRKCGPFPIVLKNSVVDTGKSNKML